MEEHIESQKQNEQNPDIPVVILCGGRGTRLKEETEIIPKPLVKIGERPLLWHIMKIYSAHGWNHFILPVGYKGEKIKEYFLNYDILQGDFTVDMKSGGKTVTLEAPVKEQWKVTIADTGLKTEAGARIKLIEPYITGDRFFLTYGDGVSNVDIHELLKFHTEQGKIATVTGVRAPARFGEITMEEDSAASFAEKPRSRQGYINGGFFVLERSIFQFLKKDEWFNFERDALPVLAKERQLAVFRHDGYWQCMDTPRDMELLEEQWQKGSAPWKVWE